MFSLEPTEFVYELIEVGVGDFRFVELVVALIVIANQFAKLIDAKVGHVTQAIKNHCITALASTVSSASS
jgi:hypothetical protein